MSGIFDSFMRAFAREILDDDAPQKALPPNSRSETYAEEHAYDKASVAALREMREAGARESRRQLVETQRRNGDFSTSPVIQNGRTMNNGTNVGTDLYSGLQHFSAHNIPVLTHRIVVATGDGQTVFFQQVEDAQRYAKRIIRRGMEDEVAIFELHPLSLIKASSPLVEIE